MTEETLTPTRKSSQGEPTWEVPDLFPRQGTWSEEDYLALTRHTRRLIEFTDGYLEFLPWPTLDHQAIVRFLFLKLDAFVVAHALGETYFAPLRVRLDAKHYREPDIVFLRPGRPSFRNQPEGADLVVEVVSPGAENRERDLVTKPADYARAGVQEYWIIDPEQREIKVLALDGTAYREHGTFRPGDSAPSLLLAGFTVDVSAVFAAGEMSGGAE